MNYSEIQIEAFIREAGDRATAIERERCAQIAEDERVDAEDTQHPADIAYNDACRDIARAIRESSERSK